MKHIFETAIDSVNTAYPSIYSKEDVVKLIEDLKWSAEQELQHIENTKKPNLTQEDVNGILDEVREGLIEGVKNIDLADFVTLELNYNHQTDIDVDMRGVCDHIQEAFDLACSEHAEVK